MSTVMTYRSYAKINLYLDVLNKRRDGFHNIETIFQTVSLADDITFEDQPSLVTMTCSSTELDTGEGNLVHRAAMLLREQTGCKMGVRIHLEKHIPIAAGLAGGSGNAAATLIALNKFWDLRLAGERIRDLALKLGSDVPYCTVGGTAAATQRGEELIPLPVIPPAWFVLVHPPMAVSAGHAYNHPMLEHNGQAPFAGRTPAFRKAIRELARGGIPCILFNRMEHPVFHDHPQLAEIKQRLLELGCTAAAMSGSGPTIFGVCPERRFAARVAEMLPEYRTSIVNPVPVGVERIT